MATAVLPSSAQPQSSQQYSVSPTQEGSISRLMTAASRSFDALHDTLVPQKSKGVTYGLRLLEHGTKLLNHFTALAPGTMRLGETAALARGIINIPTPLSAIQYFKDFAKKPGPKGWQAAGTGLIGVLNSFNTLKCLDKFGLQPLGQIAASFGKIPVVTAALGLSGGCCLLMQAYATWHQEVADFKASKLKIRMWEERRTAFNAFVQMKNNNASSANKKSQWIQLGQAGSRPYAQLQNERMRSLNPSAVPARANDPWLALVGQTFKEYSPLSQLIGERREIGQLNTLHLLEQKIGYEEQKCEVERHNSHLNLKKTYIKVACQLAEVVLSIFLLLGAIYTGIGFLAVNGLLGLILAIVVPVLGLYQIYYEHKHLPQPIPPAPGEVVLDFEEKCKSSRLDLLPSLN